MKTSNLLSHTLILLLLSCSISTMEGQQLFDKYTWLSSIVDPGDCQGTVITEYDLGHYAFIDISTGNEGLFYFEDGRLFCTSAPNYDCVTAYGFNDSQIGLQFNCPDSTTMTIPCEELEQEERLHCNFPWLDDLVDLRTCTSGSVTVYQSGIHQYLNVITPTAALFYYQDGSLFCTNGVNYNCPSLYGFETTDIVEDYSCDKAIDFTKLEGEYRIDYMGYDDCPWWPASTIDIIDLDTNCVIDQGLERCLRGSILLDTEGAFSFGFSYSGPAATGGWSKTGGSGRGSFKYEAGQAFICYGDDQDNCMETDFQVIGDRIEFDTTIEGCPLRLGGVKE